MSEENVEVVRCVYARWSKGDFSSSDVYSPDFTLVINPGIPESGTYAGRDALVRYMTGFLESWDHISISARSFESTADKVLAAVVQHGTGRSSGVSVELAFFHVWTVRDGAAARCEVLRDEDQARRLAGLSAPA